MDENLNQKLEYYSKINFQNDLKNLENDVNRRIKLNRPKHKDLKSVIEGWIGMPAPISASVMALALVIGISMGMQIQAETAYANHDALGFDVFSTKSPLSLSAPRQ